MAIRTTAGKAIINSVLPKEERDYGMVMDKKQLKKTLNSIGQNNRHLFKDVVFKLKKIGEKVAYIDGSSFSLSDFETPIDKSILDKEIENMSKRKIDKNELPAIGEKFSKIQKDIERKTLAASLKRNNSLAKMVVSGARGNPSQLASTIASPVMYMDSQKRPIPIPIKNSFSEGLDPVEYWASTYGTRRGVIATKFATPAGGFFNKQVGYVTGSLLIDNDDCGTTNGISTSAMDSENIGRVLAQKTGGFPAGTKIDSKVMTALSKGGQKKIIIRSPMTCESKEGICKKCYGNNEKGVFPGLGDNVGINSAAALTEPFTQGSMKEKHTGGVIGGAKAGFELVQQLVKIPKNFPGGATVSEIHGKVKEIKEAPQGGFHVEIGDKNHYVRPQQKLLVKRDQEVEQGEPLSDGVINPFDVTRLRGVGEGRKFLSDSLKNAYNEDGKKVNKVHMETLSRAMVNHVKINDDEQFTDNVPGDIITLSKAQRIYKPRALQTFDTKKSLGKVLAKPYLHFTSGTKLTKKMVNELSDSGIKKVETTEHDAPFDPVMIRLDDVPAYKENWLQRLYSVQLKNKLSDATMKGEEAPLHSKDFIPSYIHGVEFGKPKINY